MNEKKIVWNATVVVNKTLTKKNKDYQNDDDDVFSDKECEKNCSASKVDSNFYYLYFSTIILLVIV